MNTEEWLKYVSLALISFSLPPGGQKIILFNVRVKNIIYGRIPCNGLFNYKYRFFSYMNMYPMCDALKRGLCEHIIKKEKKKNCTRRFLKFLLFTKSRENSWGRKYKKRKSDMLTFHMSFTPTFVCNLLHQQ